MVTVVKYYGDNRVEMHGLSTDAKPMEVIGKPLGNASIFYEMDTQKASMFDAENQKWLEQ